MSKQVQQRGDTASNLSLTVPAARETAMNTTRKRIHLGDGATSGGIPHANYLDIQESTFIYATAGGTADALTLTLTPAPASYVAGQKFVFKASATNTGAATLNVNSIGVRNIFKRSGGVIGALAANDILNGGIYEVVYDGTQFQITATEAGASILSVSQGDLNTSTGTVSASGGLVNLPGGEYGFCPQIARTNNTTALAVFCNRGAGYSTTVLLGGTSSTTLPSFTLVNTNKLVPCIENTAIDIGYMQQRYVTSSPPYDLGDGEVGGFIFLKLDSGGNVLSHYAADAPPWAYNGPTDIRCTKRCPLTGKKYRRVQLRSLAELMDGASPEYEYQEITQAIKNADMNLIPHPFGPLQAGETVVLIDTMDTRVRKLIDYQNQGGADEIAREIIAGKIYVDNEPMSRRKGPNGVNQYALRFKYGKK